ncbi:response regulator transcription factor [Bifidobacterium breve]|uniref:response regulator transcription factor n=1 Tax=Bifidobacterium breve TaxID=1685 RepID=UPI0026217E12|nr:response regulator transcription factor [Bifidobacterium breve]
MLPNASIDAIVCGGMTPRMDGFTMIGLLQQMVNMTPTLIITARDSVVDKKTGFQKGTDDYMVKPINVNEMAWRVEALLRRSQIGVQHRAQIGNTEFDADTLSVRTEQADGGVTEVQLLLKEFQLLFKLASSPNRFFTRRQIMEDIWESDGSDTHTLDVHISRLRERFRGNPDFEIMTIRELGYKVVQCERA